MKNLLYLFPFFILFLFSACTNEEAAKTEDSTTATAPPKNLDATIKLPDNFYAVVVHDSIGRMARHIAVRDNGDVYVQMRIAKEGYGVTALRDTSNDGQADIIERFGTQLGTGMAIYNNYLYSTSTTAVYRYPLPENSLSPDTTAREMIAGDFIKQRDHAAKSLAFDKEGNMYVNVGAPSNCCMKEARTPGSVGLDPCPQLERQGGVWRFDANKANQTQVKDGFRYASGIRNAVALEWNYQTNKLYAVQHGRDQLNSFFPDLYSTVDNAELPAEEFFEIEEGDFFGWPYCYFNSIDNKKVLSPEYGGDGKKIERCVDAKDPILSFPAHMAPNDLVFYTGNQFPERYKDGAFVAFHGSWNRAPLEQKGYFVVFVPFQNGKPTGEWKIFAEGFGGKDVQPRTAKHRPTGLAQGADGALYVTDSRKGKIWKVVYSD